ncbi:MAG TPA: TonB-dependent receptor [Steroidobacteraceae bacterium]
MLQKRQGWEVWTGMGCRVGLLALLPATGVLAAEPAADAGGVDQLTEVTVTAQRFAQNLQRVPIVVDTISGEQAIAQGTTNFQGLVAALPNVSFTTGFNATNTYIRGVGDNSASPNNQPSTAVYVDGVYYAQAQALTTFNFNNIERIEVLKGPQGTLFGRNATAGVIQVITPDPKHDVSGKVEGGYGNYATYQANGYLTGGITDKLAADVSLQWIKQNDGFGVDVNTGTPTYRQQAFAVRSKWLYEPTDTTKVRFVYDYEAFLSGGTPDQYAPESVGYGPTTNPKAAYDHQADPGFYNVYGADAYNNNWQWGGALTIDQDIGSALHLTSITSYRQDAGSQALNSAVSAPNYPATLNYITQRFDGHYVTQELHLTNRNPDKLTWQLGAFYYGDQVFGADPRFAVGSLVAGGFQQIRGSENTASGAVFAEATEEIFDQTRVTAGVRWTTETIKSFTSTQNAAGAFTAGPYSGPAYNQKDHPLTYRIALDHNFTSDFMAYASYNRGFKTGGYNLLSPGSAPYYGEHVNAYELGLKSEWFDHRVRFNVSGFYYDYTDMQVTIILGGNQLFTNAGNSRIKGIDASLDWAATQHVTLSAGLGLLNGVYTDYPGARGYTPWGTAINIANAKGADVPYAPRSSYNVSAVYHDLATPIGTFDATAQFSHTSKSYATPDMGLARPAYSMLGGTIKWSPPTDNSWAVKVWGKNLTGAKYYTFSAESATGWYVAYGPPRTYGVTVEKDF